mmetsp:Transcript_20979/g.45936  ORF Transcript_20979/g.45936 Transcript_20979/m.45936 type:complete len:242 (+) Transcript_20979:124-849(+)
MASTVAHPEHEILAELENKRPMLDIHKNPLLVSILTGCEMLKAMAEKEVVPVDYIAKARGLLFMKTDKVGFGISITQGYGLVLARAPHRPSGWSAPLPIKVDGFSLGAVIGFSAQQTIVCLATDNDIDAFKADKRAMKIGVEFGLSMLEKFDKTTSFDTQETQTGEVYKTKAFTITSRGVLVDVAFKGVSVEPDTEDIEASYGKSVKPADILNGTVSPPREATILYNELTKYAQRFSAAAQ